MMKRIAKNLTAERQVLGAVLLASHEAREVFWMLEPPDFFVRSHRIIFDVAKNLWDRLGSCDLVLVCDALSRHGLLEAVGGEQYLLKLIEDVPAADRARTYAELVFNCAAKRRLDRLDDAEAEPERE